MKRLGILLLGLAVLVGGISIFNFSKKENDKESTAVYDTVKAQNDIKEEDADTITSQENITTSKSQREENDDKAVTEAIETQDEIVEEDSSTSASQENMIPSNSEQGESFNKIETETNDTIATQNNTKEDDDSSANISQEDLIRTNSQGAVDIAILFTNILEDYGSKLEFEVMLNTHSVDLEAIDFKEATTLRTSEGIEISEEIEWKIVNGGGHHITGVITSPKEINGEKVIKESTDYIEIEMRNIDGIGSRKFKWDREVLKTITIID